MASVRIALISDIHGNTPALDAVLDDIRHVGVDTIVCLGDIAAGGPDPGGAVDRIAALDGVTVQGNTDLGVVDVPGWWRDPASIGLPTPARPGMEICVWGAEQLDPEQRRYLAELPTTATVELPSVGELLAFHGSPRSSDDVITATTPGVELTTMLQGADAALLAGGHTHVPLVRRHEQQTVVNPGSVGMPFAGYGYPGGVTVLDHAAYAVVVARSTHLSVELRQVGVNADTVREAVERSGMPKVDWWHGLRDRPRQ